MTSVGAGPGAARSTGHPGGPGGAGAAPGAANVDAPGGGGTGPGSSWAAADDRQVAARHSPADSANPHRIRVIGLPPSRAETGIGPRAGIVDDPARSIREPRRAVDILLLQVQVAVDVQRVVPGRGGAEVDPGLRLDPVQEVELEIVGLLDLVARARGHLVP